MAELTKRLNDVPDSYFGFVAAVLTYVKKSRDRYERVSDYMNANPKALSSDILEYISDQDDFYDDAYGKRVQIG